MGVWGVLVDFVIDWFYGEFWCVVGYDDCWNFFFGICSGFGGFGNCSDGD